MTVKRTILCGTLLAFGCAAPCWSQSLAEIAEKEKERRARQKAESVPEFTNADLASGEEDEETASEPSSKSSSSPASTPAAMEPGGGEGQGGESEKDAWSRRAREAREAVAKAKRKVSAIETEITKTGTRRLGSTDTMEILSLKEKERTLQKDLAQAREELAEQEKSLKDFEEEARRKSVPPGWLRE